MDRFARGLFGIAVLISLIQALHAISRDEYDRKISAIKSKPKVAQFLKDNNFIMSQHVVFDEKVSDVFTHVRKTKAGKETMDCVGREVETILKQERTNNLIKSIFEAFRKVLTSKVGVKNIFAVARFIQDQLQIPQLFKMCIFLKKILISLLLSKNGLAALEKLMKNIQSLENSPKTAPLLAYLHDELPIIPLPLIFVGHELEIEDMQTMENAPPLENIPPKKPSGENVPIEKTFQNVGRQTSSMENVPIEKSLQNVPSKKKWSIFKGKKKDKSDKKQPKLETVESSEKPGKSWCSFC